MDKPSVCTSTDAAGSRHYLRTIRGGHLHLAILPGLGA